MPAKLKRKATAPSKLWQPTSPKPAGPAPPAANEDVEALLQPDEAGDAAREEAQLAMLRASCAYFAREVLTVDGKPFIVAKHHELWDHDLAASDRVCEQAPRDHGKSLFFSYAYVIWRAAFRPNGRCFIFSATLAQAKLLLQAIKDEIENNPRLAYLYPSGKRKTWTATSIQLANGYRIFARGYGTKVRGAHPDTIVVDDALNDDDAYSEVIRKKNIDYFFTAITNMIVPGGQIVVVGTPFSPQDLYAELAKNPAYRFKKYPAITKDGTILWPGRYSEKRLAARRVEIGSVRFAREFLVEPVSDDISMFPERLFRGPQVEVYDVWLGMSRTFWNAHGIPDRYVGIDLAISAETGADSFVLWCWGVDAKGNRWIIDIEEYVGLSFRKQLSKVNAFARRYQPHAIYVEANQMQRVWGDELIAETDLPIVKFYTTGAGTSAAARRKRIPSPTTTSQNKNSLEGGIPSFRLLLENGKIRIPRGGKGKDGDRTLELTEKWIAQLRSFVWAEGKVQSVGDHDDLAMASWIAERAVKEMHGEDNSAADDMPTKEQYAALMQSLTGEGEVEEKKRKKRPPPGAAKIVEMLQGATKALDGAFRTADTVRNEEDESEEDDDEFYEEGGDEDGDEHRTGASVVGSDRRRALAEERQRRPLSSRLQEAAVAGAWRGLPGVR